MSALVMFIADHVITFAFVFAVFIAVWAVADIVRTGRKR